MNCGLFRQIPDFWHEIESKLDCKSEEILIPKVILSILSYTTKSSIAALKSKKAVKNLEDEFLKRKSTTTLLDKHYEKYPFLREIICFPSGLQITLMQIASFMSRCCADSQATTIEKVLRAADCKEITAANILLSENGLSCHIVCPECKQAKKLSSSEHGSTSFSASNFDRHYKLCKAVKRNESNDILSGTSQNGTEGKHIFSLLFAHARVCVCVDQIIALLIFLHI